MNPIPLMVELCAGTAALSLRLHRDGAKPPVSRMGSKSGYSSVILRVLGLIPGQRAERYLWCEPDPGVRLLLEAYRDAGLAREAAAVIRSWAAEDPRALWERLRAEGPPRLPDGGAEAGEVARWGLLGAWSFRKGEPESGFNLGYVAARPSTATEHGSNGRTVGLEAALWGRLPDALPATVAPDARDVDPREVARWCQITASNELINVAWSEAAGRWQNTGKGGTTFGGPIGYGGDRVPGKLDALPGDLPAVVTTDARAVDPREVARFMRLVTSNRLIPGAWSADGRWVNAARDGGAHTKGGLSFGGDDFCTSIDTLAAAAESVGGDLPAAITPDAREVDPGPALPPGTVCYMDPPYLNTTGYAADLPRADVVALARRWAAAGAVVAISEAEPIPELVAEGWWKVRIDGERVGQPRTFSKQQAEWLTLNRAPAWVPSVQGALFGGR
jgi:hypothetical protein